MASSSVPKTNFKALIAGTSVERDYKLSLSTPQLLATACHTAYDYVNTAPVQIQPAWGLPSKWEIMTPIDENGKATTPRTFANFQLPQETGAQIWGSICSQYVWEDRLDVGAGVCALACCC